jgi:hypothetical protein
VNEHDEAILSAALTWATVHDEYLEGENTREESDRLALELLEAVRAYWASLPKLPPFES